jgi:type VI secretion system protein ImpH
MPPTKRRFEPAVIERLFKEPYRFEYFNAVRMLELWLARHGIAQDEMVPGFLRFQNSTSLSFPASQIEAIDTEPSGLSRDANALAEALHSATLKYVRITPAFMGLLGNSGVLPAHYTERFAEHQLHQKDNGPQAFLDTFSNRSLALFYQAWRKYRLAFKCQPGGHDTFLPLLLSLAGIGHASLCRRLANEETGCVLDESIGYFAASIRHRPTSAVQIARLLSEYFGRQVLIKQFVGAWYDVPLEQQSMLGGASAIVGAGALVGARVWQCALRMRLSIGPMDYVSFSAFLPGGACAKALKSMLLMLTGVALEYEVELVLRAADVRGAVLSAGSTGSRLGWDSYLVGRPQDADRNDVHYEIKWTDHHVH